MSTVIKAGQEFKLVKQPSTIDLADHMAEADKVIAEAKAKARLLLERAEKEASSILETAEKKGFAQGRELGHQQGMTAGRAEGLEEARKKFDTDLTALRTTFESVIFEFDAQKQNLLIEAKQSFLDFAVALARKVVKHTCEIDLRVVEANVEQALGLVSAKTDLAVRVNPAEADTVRRFCASLAEKLKQAEHVAVVEDERISRGGCTVQTENGQIDARIETQMAEIMHMLAGCSLDDDEESDQTAEPRIDQESAPDEDR